MATYYWVPGGTNNWTSSSNWASSSGGAGGAGIPSISDDVVFDANSGTSSSRPAINSNVSVNTITGTAFPGVLVFGANTLTVAGTGAAFNFYNRQLSANLGAKVTFTYSGASAMTVSAGTSLYLSFIFTAGSYALSFRGSAYNLDFWQSGASTYSGTASIVSGALSTVDGTLSLNPGMSFSGSAFLYFMSTSYIRTNGVTVAANLVIAQTLTLLDALSMPANRLIWNGEESVLIGSGKNITASRIEPTFIVDFGASIPTWTCSVYDASINYPVSYYGIGTATISLVANGTMNHAGQRIPATLNLLGNATVTSGAPPAASVPAGEFLGLKNSGYGTLTVAKNTNFVEFALKGNASNTQYLNGSGATIGKVDPWYVGANSTDGGGNTNIIFTAGEGVDYLNVSNVVGSYNYGPHFMAFM